MPAIQTPNEPQPPQLNNAGGGVRNPDVEDNMMHEGQPLFNENSTRQELIGIIGHLQIQHNEQKRKLREVTLRLSELESAERPNRRRRGPAPEPTPLDRRYRTSGQRCAISWNLWITPELYELAADATYSEDRRYLPNEPAMQLQGNRHDMISSMPEGLIQGFNDNEHHQKVFGEGLSIQRRTIAARVRACGSLDYGATQDQFKNHEFRESNEDFKDLLGFNAGAEALHARWPALAPVLYLDGQTRNANKAFRSHYIKNVFRCYMFGPSSIDSPVVRHAGPKVLAEVLGIKTITVGAIAAAATLTRWAISPDKQFKVVGETTGINWKSDYEQYKKLLIKSLCAEKVVIDRDGEDAEIGPYTRLMAEWNTEFFPTTCEAAPAPHRNGVREIDQVSDIEAAIAEAEAFAQRY